MALMNVAKMLSRRLFSRGTRGVTGGTDTGQHITDEKLRSLYQRIKKSIAEADQLRDECDTYYALRRAFPRDRIALGVFIFGVGINAVENFYEVSKCKNAIKDMRSQLSALRNANKDKESQL